MKKQEKVLVGMSGGVDSSVTVALLLEAGYQVRGITLIPWHASALGFTATGTPDETVKSAKKVADQLGIDLDVVEVKEEFYEKVVGYFVSGYREGKTPNPCYVCNRVFKWVEFLRHADTIGYDYVSTGHYARLEKKKDGRMRLFQAEDPAKDQSYVLSCLDQQVLQRILLPLGEYKKSKVREMALSMKIASAGKSDSQDLCFVRNEDHKALVRQLLGSTSSRNGDIVRVTGEIIGTHNGLENYTYGQRKGIRIAAVEPYYVIGKNLALNQLIVGQKLSGNKSGLLTSDVHWISGFAPAEWFLADVQIRYHAKAAPAIIKLFDDGKAEIEFSENVIGITPGQFAVIYQGSEVLGAAEILKEIDKR